jgi:hypothetical protein
LPESLRNLDSVKGDVLANNPDLAARLEAVAGNAGFVYQEKVIRALLGADFDTYVESWEPRFDELNAVAQAMFAKTVWRKSQDEERKERYLKHLLDFVQLKTCEDWDAQFDKDWPPAPRIEGYVVEILGDLNRTSKHARDERLRQQVEEATVASLTAMSSRDNERARYGLFSELQLNHPLHREYADKVPELFAYGARSESRDTLKMFFVCAAAADNEVGHARALELLESEDADLVLAGLGGLRWYRRGQDLEAILPLVNREDDRVPRCAVQVLSWLEPLPVRQLADLLDKSPEDKYGFLRFEAFQGLKRNLDIDVEFDYRKTGSELSQEKQKIVDWLKEHGHLD